MHFPLAQGARCMSPYALTRTLYREVLCESVVRNRTSLAISLHSHDSSERAITVTRLLSHSVPTTAHYAALTGYILEGIYRTRDRGIRCTAQNGNYI